jgi:NTE family protein
MWFSFRPRPAPLSLALQGGGAHGAYTWGVLDALLERGVPIAAISGASAGAMNAAALAHGLAAGGADAARAALESFWQAIAQQMPPMWHQPGDPPSLSPAAHALMAWSLFFSPAQLNPLGANPLRDVLTSTIDFDRVRRSSGPALHIAATDAASGRLRVFGRHELSVDTLLASACLPTLSPAVDIGGRAWWDGALAGNPPLLPLVQDTAAHDLMIVMLSPLSPPAPLAAGATAAQIRERLVDMAFNAAFLCEARVLGLLSRQAQRRRFMLFSAGSALARTRWHLIDADGALCDLPGSTRLLPDWSFLLKLRDAGRERTAQWWSAHAAAIGRRSTADLAECFGPLAAA